MSTGIKIGSGASAATLVDLLEERAARPRAGYSFLRDGVEVTAELSFAELARQARAVAERVRRQAAPGSRALLLYPPGLSVLPALFGCLYAGVVAVPVPPPDGARLKRTLPRLRAVVEDAAPELALTTAALADETGERLKDFLPPLGWLATDEITADESYSGWRAPDIGPQSLAYLQYTSGSTTSPRGVMISHANVLHNLGYLKSGFGYDDDSLCVTWMPYFHDYGLVEGLLQPLYSNIPTFLMSPLAVLKRPLRWLHAISRLRATHSHGPNFAYEMCLRRAHGDQLGGLDLSSWKVAGNGAEPVRADTLRRFSETFAPHGFRAEAFYPGYGLAESTLFVTTRPHDAEPRSLLLSAKELERHRVEPAGEEAGSESARRVMSCGSPQGATRLRIVDPETLRECAPERVGEIWINDPSVALGYWGREEDTRATFGARLAGDGESLSYLRTGDLGFVRGGELYVTGRLKDLIIVGGVNHYPQDIEWTVQSTSAELRRDSCAAFSVELDGEEQLVVVAEVERTQADWEPLVRRIRESVSAGHELSVAAVALLRHGGVFKTSSGKLQRGACRRAFLADQLSAHAIWRRERAAAPAAEGGRAKSSELRRWLCEQLAAPLRVSADDIDPHATFAEYGLDSRAAVALVAAIEDRIGVELSPTLLWQYPTVSALCEHLSRGGEPDGARGRSVARGVGEGEAVAIVGMACRFPGASNAREFWSLLRAGADAVGPSARMPGVEAGFIESAEEFDAEFFGLSASEARAMDPQQRVLLEVAWEALENAGLRPGAESPRRGGVFVGISAADHAVRQLRRSDAAGLLNAHSGTGLAFSIAANRLSYLLNLSGPSMAVDTACSSSLVAVHQARLALLRGECDFALAGGVNLILSPHIHLALERAGILSPTWRCKTFDASADGYARGEGCGLIVLKRLSDARRDGEAVLAVVRATAVNQDGRSNGMTAPNPSAQRALLRDALAEAGLSPGAVDYVEAHGTGTRLGDPIEMGSIQAVLGEGRGVDERCWVGSVKSNIGHLESAAGVAGLIKTVLALRHAEVPPQANLRSVNPIIKLDGSPFRIAVGKPEPWPRNANATRRAAVNSFGFGGTNAHVIIEQDASAEEPASEGASGAEATGGGADRTAQLFTLSAHNQTALRELAARYADFLRERPDTSLHDLCHTTNARRAHLPERVALSATSVAEVAGGLQSFARGEHVASVACGRAAAQRPGVVFLFSGQGAQHAGMARRLYETEPGFRRDLDECDALTRERMGRPLLSVVFGDDAELINQTVYTQPALFAVEYALARLWRRWGVEPAAVLGHSIGEYVAACVAGVFSLEDGLKLVAARGRLIQRLPAGGAMLVVLTDEARAREEIRDYVTGVSVAAVNAPRSVVLAGGRAALERLNEKFAAAGIACRFLTVSHAFHSPLLAPVLEEFRELAAGLEYSAPRLPWIGNLDGRPVETAPDADYWTRHLRETVRFADGVARLGASHRLFLEIGPRPVLGVLGAQCVADADAQFLPSLRPGVDDWSVMLDSLARLHVAGVTPDWRGFDAGRARRHVEGLPNYPFQRKLFAPPPLPAGESDGRELLPAEGRAGPTDERRAPHEEQESVAADVSDVSGWGYVPRWEQAPTAAQHDKAEWLLLADGQGVAESLRALLEARGHACTLIEGESHAPLPRAAAGRLPDATVEPEPLQVVCLWALDWPRAASLDAATLPSVIESIVGRLLPTLQQIGEGGGRAIRLWLVTREAVAPSGETGGGAAEGLLQSLLWGLGRALRGEYPEWQVRLVDLGADDARAAAEQLFEECGAADVRAEVCWRGRERYGWSLRPRRLEREGGAESFGGAWLVTGGLSGLGLKAAEWLAGRGARHLLLIGRRAPGAEAGARVAAMRAAGASVEVRALDVGDYEGLRQLLGESRPGWPTFEGVVHAAGVRDDAVLHRQTAARFEAVLRPKVLGGWNLHLLTAGLPLRYFILFSSASSLLGNPGQGAYAAANAFLDALANYRRARGLPALSLNWSAWEEAATDPAVARQLARRGLVPIESEHGTEALARALTLDLPQIAVLPSSSGRKVERLSNDTTDAPRAASAPGSADGLLGRLRSLPPEERAAELRAHVLRLAASILEREPGQLDGRRGFTEQGLDSLNIVELRNRLERDLGRSLPVTIAFNHPTAEALAEELLRQFVPPTGAAVSRVARHTPAAAPAEADHDAVAIIGMGCRMPGGASGPAEFWRLLSEGRDAISEVPPDRWDIESLYHPDPDHPGTIVTRHGGFIDAVEEFDATFFGISPREVAHLDPQQRLLLEVCWETFEHAGLPAASLAGTQTGVFVGISTNDYLRRLNRRPEEIDAYLATGNSLSLAANRLSYVFGLEGPSLAIDTACSSSLVAIHQACRSLRDGESDLALAGGVNLLLDPTVSINHSRAHMLAPDGRCKAFSAAADGMVRSEGCGLILLKRLSDALRDGDTVHAVIRGTAVNQDGRTSGLTVPNGPAQQRVIRRALERAGLEPSAVSYVEAHGTGTPLGDPIEADALSAVYGQRRARLAVGSVKSNIGHLESAAGVAGLIKTVLALQHRTIPASLHCDSLNPRVDWERGPLRVPVRAESWSNGPEPRRAGVSSFGFGGTNAHAVLEQAPAAPPRDEPALARYLLPLSAKTETALCELARRFSVHLSATTEHAADICYTAACGRDHFAHRLAVAGRDAAALRDRLDDWLAGRDAADAWAGRVAGNTDARGAERTARARDESAVDETAALYVSGAGVDWPTYYSGLPLRRVPLPGHPFERQNFAVEPPAPASPRARVYRLHWTDEARQPTPPAAISDHWLILADAMGWGEAVASELKARGARCTVVYRAPVNGGRRGLPPEDDEALRALLGDAGDARGIVHLWGLDSPSPAALDAAGLLEAQRQHLGGVLRLVRALKDEARPPRLWLVSRAAQSAAAGDRVEGLAQAALWGLGRTLPLELPWLWGGLLDLPADAPNARDAATACAFLYDAAGDTQRALRSGRLLAPRLRPWAGGRAGASAVRADASYLIAGGLGSLGRELGRWLARRGARSIWVIGRRGADDAGSRAYLEELRGLGVAARAAAIDVTDTARVAAQLDEWRRLGPELRGVFHAAGLGSQAQLSELDWPSFASILAPKAAGAWALHHSTAGCELDFFVNCSSIAGLWGSHRQAAYSAANAFLDGFAAYRRGCDQPALSVNWGPLLGTPLLDDEAAEDLRSYGIHPTPVSRAAAELDTLLGDGAAQAAVVAADWERFAPLYTSRCATNLFAELADGDRTRAPAADPVAAVHTSPAAATSPASITSPAGLRAWLTEQLCAALRLAPERLDADAPLPRLGLDSLMAVQLRNRLQQQLGLAVSLQELLGELSLNGLVGALSGAAAGAAGAVVATPAREGWITGDI